ncbi:MAG: hypothetical protein ABEH80_03040, partial [Halobaculum sp.]
MTDDNTDAGGDHDDAPETESEATDEEDSVDEPLYDESDTVEIDFGSDDFRDLSPTDEGDDTEPADSDSDPAEFVGDSDDDLTES